ncbi:MAG: hypothetical protein H0U51_00720 [Propionibacteriales bacterium]|nr:hypothetical protein [Propionibacteriales bacterium]
MNISITDALDLPDWLGTEQVSWQATTSLIEAPHVPGRLDGGSGLSHPLDLLAVDAAFPQAICPEPERQAAHQAWHYGEVLLVEIDLRLAAAVPGTRFDANVMCEALRRVAKSVGAPASNFTVVVTL